ncbi:uncharacterized protein LOC127747676 [Arachis duranensis]|uniref:Uncharacterized protein LOC127747676 n=1 Tax=Arachis duranensis TaxID=130453 RepID=A0A9C6WQ78_ARADU|nr:uncharacterized protein LOC127747676 [Arachis duranensis]
MINNMVAEENNDEVNNQSQREEFDKSEPYFTLEQREALLALLNQQDAHPTHSINQIVTTTFPSNQVSKLTADLKCKLIFEENECEIQDKTTMRTIGVAEQRRGLYAFEDLTPIQTTSQATSISLASTLSAQHTQIAHCELWHLRLGYLPNDKIAKAINSELTVLRENRTWTLTKLPNGKKAVECKWVFKLKLKSDGLVDRHKARLVAQGFIKTTGVDYFETYSPMVKMNTFPNSHDYCYSEGLHLHDLFKIKDIGELQFFLELEVVRMSEYRRLVGRLLYLTNTRPDIGYAVGRLSQFLECATDKHFEAAIRVLKYLKNEPALRLMFSSQTDLEPTGFSDSDWGTAIVSWKSKKRNIVAMSLCEVEYRALAMATREAQWITYILEDMQVKLDKSIAVYCDSQSALHIAANLVFHERTKHIDMDCHVVKDK